MAQLEEERDVSQNTLHTIAVARENRARGVLRERSEGGQLPKQLSIYSNCVKSGLLNRECEYSYR